MHYAIEGQLMNIVVRKNFVPVNSSAGNKIINDEINTIIILWTIHRIPRTNLCLRCLLFVRQLSSIRRS